jgi:hypothetical protein
LPPETFRGWEVRETWVQQARSEDVSVVQSATTGWW